MRKAVDRFWSWLFHPSIVRYNYPDTKAAIPRYPAPGNQINQQELHDFKEPFSTSIYNIRYRHQTPAQLEGFGSYFVSDPLSGYKNSEQKLIAYGFLKKGQETSKQFVDKAKQEYFNLYKVPIQKNEYRNDFGYKMPIKGDRDTFRYVTELGPRSNRASLDRLPGKQYQDIYNPLTIEMESLDMFAGDPDYRQCVVEVTYALDNYCALIVSLGQIDIMRGNKQFWKALDDINDPENIIAVQRQIHDPDPLDFSLHDRPIKFIKDKQGKIVDVLP